MEEICTVQIAQDNGGNKDNGTFVGARRRRKTFQKYDKASSRQFWFWFTVVIFFLGVASCVASLKVPYLRHATIRGVGLWQLCILITAVLAGLPVSHTIHKFVLLFIDHEFEFSTRENVIYYALGLVKSGWVVLWFGLIFLAWKWVVFDQKYLGVPQENETLRRKYSRFVEVITLTLITILLGSFLWLIKKLLMMIAKSVFHIRRFFDRIKETLMHQYMMKTLSRSLVDATMRLSEKTISFEKPAQEPESILFSRILGKLKKVGKSKMGFRTVSYGRKEKRIIDLASLENVNQNNVTDWGMKILIKEVITDRPLTYINENEEEQEINSENDVKRAADIIFSNMIGGDGVQEFIGKEQLEQKLSHYFPDSSQAMQWLLEGADANKIDKEVFRKCMINTWKKRTTLVRALLANKKLFRQLNRFVNVVTVIVIVIVWLVMIKAQIRKAMPIIGTAIAGSAFIFGDTFKKVLNNFTFIFVMHPFDVGDCCLIENTPVLIGEIDLFTTVAYTLEDEKRVYPNTNLSGLTISNYTGSHRHMGDSVVFSLTIGTPQYKIDKLKTFIASYIKENSHYWLPMHELVLDFDLRDDLTTKMKATLHFRHTMNYHHYRDRERRKSLLVSKIKEYLHQLKLIPNGTTPSEAPMKDDS